MLDADNANTDYRSRFERVERELTTRQARRVFGADAVTDAEGRLLAGLVLGLEHDDSRVRQPVELGEPEPKPPLEVRPEGGQRDTPGEAHRVVVVIRGRRALVQQGQRRAHEVEDGRTECPDLVPEPRNRESLAEGRRCPENQGRHHGQDRRIEVKQRKRAIEHVIGAKLQMLDDELGVAYRISV